MHLAAARDVGAGVLPDRAHARARTRLLSGQLGLTVRLVRATVIAWIGALAATGLVLGLIAKSAGTTISGSSVKTVFSRLGAPGTGAGAFLGVSFLIVAVLVAFVAAGQVTAARRKKRRAASTTSWSGPCPGSPGSPAGSGWPPPCSWPGALSPASPPGWARPPRTLRWASATLLDAGLNVVPPAVCLLGIGVLAMGVWPRATSDAVYGVLGWSLLIELVGGVFTTSHWLPDTSLFHQMAAAPAVRPDWTTGAVMVGIGAACAGVGALAFRLRDVQGE